MNAPSRTSAKLDCLILGHYDLGFEIPRANAEIEGADLW